MQRFIERGNEHVETRTRKEGNKPCRGSQTKDEGGFPIEIFRGKMMCNPEHVSEVDTLLHKPAPQHMCTTSLTLNTHLNPLIRGHLGLQVCSNSDISVYYNTIRILKLLVQLVCRDLYSIPFTQPHTAYPTQNHVMSWHLQRGKIMSLQIVYQRSETSTKGPHLILNLRTARAKRQLPWQHRVSTTAQASVGNVANINWQLQLKWVFKSQLALRCFGNTFFFLLHKRSGL